VATLLETLPLSPRSCPSLWQVEAMVCQVIEPDPEVVAHQASKVDPVTFLLADQEHTVVTGAIRMMLGEKWNQVGGVERDRAFATALAEICAEYVNRVSAAGASE
jgi:hypothetical protein